MRQYLCSLVEDGVVVERFIKYGHNVQEVKEELDFFQWPDGDWRIKAVEEIMEDE